ncbi:hypothetical protein HY970_01990 [Candidatus Kaiserbacteria bacterium]|nr:hypothetical protein [Candidatus Kaiserbacteria bacterium]
MAELPDGRSHTLANILAIAGFIILAIIVVWGLIHLASLSSPWFSSLFHKDKSITVTVPSQLTSGEPVHIKWSYKPKAQGTYTLLYKCADSVQIAVPAPENAFRGIPCGAAFTLGNATSSMLILPISAATSSQKTTLTILYIPSAAGTTEPEASGSANISIKPGTMPPQKPQAEKPLTPAKPSQNREPSSGPADLVATIISITNEPGGTVAAQFNISNMGGSSTGTYYFTASLPTAQPYTYMSDPQPSLAPGAHVVNTLRFTQPIPGTFSVVVDPSNFVRETNESNNSASQYVSGYGAYYPYPYGN